MSTRASSIADPASGLSYSGAVVAQVQPETLSFRIDTQPTTASAPTQAVSSVQAPDKPADGNGTTNANQPDFGAQNTAAVKLEDDEFVCDRTQSDLFCVYEIQPGDTLSGIAQKAGLKGNEDVAPWELLVYSNKPDIVSEDDLLQVGQKLRIPNADTPIEDIIPASPAGSSGGDARRSAIVHTVLKSETLSDIADQYGVDVDDIVAANNLSDPDSLQIGEDLLIPNPTQLTPAPSAAADAGEDDTPDTVPTGPKSKAGFIWPVAGPISSYFGPGHPLGIDIDLYASPNAPIAAVAAGTVTFAGGNTCCSYGLYVIVDHGNGFQTLYAHLSKINVSVGQKVSQGSVVGLGGRTGYSTGNHLHFEVHLNGAIVNPIAYLP